MTKAERLFFLLTEVDDALVEEAAVPLFPVPKKRNWGGWAALAACLLLVVGLVRFVPFGGMGSSSEAPDGAPAAPSLSAPVESSAPAESADSGEVPPNGNEYSAGDGNGGSTGGLENTLPILSLSGQFAEGAGGSGIWIEDVDSYISGGLSPDAVGDTLPVYVSTLPRDERGDPASTDIAAMETLLAEILSRFGLEPDDCALTYQGIGIAGKEDMIGYLDAVTPDGTEISVNYDLVAAITLPLDGLSDAIRHADHYDLDSMNALGEAVIQELGWLLDMESPTASITGGDVNLYGQTQFDLTIHDGDPSDVTAPIAYTFGVFKDELIVRLDGHGGRKLVAEYPVITLEEAEALLLSGSWPGYHKKWYTIPTAEQILRAELVYCTDTSGLTMPYYRFYLDLGETVELFERNDQLPTGETVPQVEFYYVPAVEGEYLSPSYSGLTFNS